MDAFWPDTSLLLLETTVMALGLSTKLWKLGRRDTSARAEHIAWARNESLGCRQNSVFSTVKNRILRANTVVWHVLALFLPSSLPVVSLSLVGRLSRPFFFHYFDRYLAKYVLRTPRQI